MKTLTTQQNGLMEAILKWEAKNQLKFKPQRQFYKTMGLSRIKFWQIAKGEKGLTVEEARILSDYFKVPISTFF